MKKRLQNTSILKQEPEPTGGPPSKMVDEVKKQFGCFSIVTPVVAGTVYLFIIAFALLYTVLKR